MTAKLEFFFDFGSPTSYLAYTQVPRIAARTKAMIAYRPFLLGGVFKATGNSSPVTVPAKGKYMGADMARFARRYGVPLAANPFFPINTLHLMRGAVASQMEGQLTPYADAVFHAMWVEPKNMGDWTIASRVIEAAGIDSEGLRAATERDDVKQRLKETTEEAVARGAFGAPTFFIGEEMFFGQDRLDFVEEALVRAA
jgi:2-hydroxychromene-2-carboxylate isomerase